jgi:hypothetical protein
LKIQKIMFVATFLSTDNYSSLSIVPFIDLEYDWCKIDLSGTILQMRDRWSKPDETEHVCMWMIVGVSMGPMTAISHGMDNGFVKWGRCPNMVFAFARCGTGGSSCSFHPRLNSSASGAWCRSCSYTIVFVNPKANYHFFSGSLEFAKFLGFDRFTFFFLFPGLVDVSQEHTQSGN